MRSLGRLILGHMISGIKKMNRVKEFEDDAMETPLKRCLTTFDITLLGVGHMVGAGIYVLTGTVAHYIAGPGVMLSFLLAGVASSFAAFCYAEFGARVPKAGSAYVYTYVTIGEFSAFVIGWNIILEHMIGAASVSRAWSGYVDSLSGYALTNLTRSTIEAIAGKTNHIWSIEDIGSLPDPLAAILCIAYSSLLACGVKGSTRLNSILTVVNLSVMALVIGLGFKYADVNNWSENKGGFLPFGTSGVLQGAAACFYAFVGFDSIATSGEEAKDPAKSIPMATILSMAIVTIGYVMVSGILTLVVPWTDIVPTAALPEAFATKSIYWAKYIISIGALCGMTTTLFGSLFSLPRIMYAMSSDGLLFSFLGRINKKTQVPIVNLAISGCMSAVIAFIFDLHNLVEFMSIGTFLAYTIVSASVLVLRYRPAKESSVQHQANLPHSVAGTPSDLKSPPTEGADSNSDCNSIHSAADSELQEFSEGTGRLRRRYAWLGRIIGNWQPGNAVATAIIIFIVASACSSGLDVWFRRAVQKVDVIDAPNSWITTSWSALAFPLFILLSLILVGCLFVIHAHEQCPPTGKFRVPWVPLLPATSIYLNISLMSHLSPMTWYRFVIWMIIGMFIYFGYGIHHSKEGRDSYTVLMTSVEAERAERESSKTTWPVKSKRKNDKVPILSSD